MTPYYLHHPDAAPGTQHFRVSLNEGLEIIALRADAGAMQLNPRPDHLEGEKVAIGAAFQPVGSPGRYRAISPSMDSRFSGQIPPTTSRPGFLLSIPPL